MKNDWRKAELTDLNTMKMIDGRLYKGIAIAVTVDGDFETQVRWHLASWKEAARYRRAVR